MLTSSIYGRWRPAVNDERRKTSCSSCVLDQGGRWLNEKKKWKLETDKEEYEHAFVSSMMLNAAVSYDAKLLIGRPQFVGVDIIV